MAALTALRMSLRSARAQGRTLSPFLNAIAGAPKAPKIGELKGDWAIGGFQAKMDRKEAKDVLGLKYVGSTLDGLGVWRS